MPILGIIASSQFIAQEIIADLLVIAGAGGGVPSSASSGGSGAGGVVNLNAQTLATNTNYAVTVGAGGSGGYINSSY